MWEALTTNGDGRRGNTLEVIDVEAGDASIDHGESEDHLIDELWGGEGATNERRGTMHAFRR